VRNLEPPEPRWELSKATVLHAKPGTALIDYKKTIVQNHAPQDAYQSEQRPDLILTQAVHCDFADANLVRADLSAESETGI